MLKISHFMYFLRLTYESLVFFSRSIFCLLVILVLAALCGYLWWTAESVQSSMERPRDYALVTSQATKLASSKVRSGDIEPHAYKDRINTPRVIALQGLGAHGDAQSQHERLKPVLDVLTVSGFRVYRLGDGRLTTDSQGGPLPRGEVLLNSHGDELDSYGRVLEVSSKAAPL